uniref:long-chain-fatty-acid--CoA ligase n=1 Tax=Hirondellea gigas TaxID=1518452 RepID=A0A2P2IBJ3_9CRUS
MVVQRSVRGEDGAWRWKSDKSGNKDGYQLIKEFNESGACTVPSIVKFSAKKNGHRPFMGTRTLIHRTFEDVDGAKHEKLEFGEYQWETYQEVYDKVLKVTASMLGMGFKPMSRVAIFAETRADWFVMAVGCLEAGITVVTLYTNLNDDSIVHGISETEVDTVISSYELLPRLCKLLPRLNKVSRVIVLEDQLEGMGNPTTMSSQVSFISFSALLLKADLNILKENRGPGQDDIAIIMYTSGSTGNPKGVLITHKNIFCSICAFTSKVSMDSSDCYLAFLPLPHIMELSTEVSLMAIGVSIAYSSPLTLTNNSPKIMKGTVGDARMAKPTYINAVPLILDRIIKGVFNNVQQQSKLKAKIFHEALKYKQNNQFGVISALTDIAIFNKVKAELGGNVRLIITGGAPLSHRTCNICAAMFGCDIKSGYGLTETTACATFTDMDDNVPCTVGTPNENVSILLEDWEEGGYRITDKPRPRGEVLVGGNAVAMGYLNLPEETRESFVERDGIRYFRTGDIGEFDDRGVMFLIDRKKDLVKLQNGEYIALGSVETVLKTHTLVDNICVFANSNEMYVVAVVVPTPDALKKMALSIGKPETESLDNLCKDDKVIKAVLKDLFDHGTKQDLKKIEMPKKLFLTMDMWSTENNLVTSAFKLRRKQLRTKYANQVASLYAST